MSMVRFSRRPARLAFQSIPGFEEMESRMRKMFDDVLSTGFEPDAGSPIGWVPAVEITENGADMVITAELPGLDRKDVDVSVDEDGVLTISGEKTEEKTEADEAKKYHLWERSYGAFRRSFTLPRVVDASAITAEFDKGVLRIRLPKTADARAKGRKIDIAVK